MAAPHYSAVADGAGSVRGMQTAGGMDPWVWVSMHVLTGRHALYWRVSVSSCGHGNGGRGKSSKGKHAWTRSWRRGGGIVQHVAGRHACREALASLLWPPRCSRGACMHACTHAGQPREMWQHLLPLPLPLACLTTEGGAWAAMFSCPAKVPCRH